MVVEKAQVEVKQEVIPTVVKEEESQKSQTVLTQEMLDSCVFEIREFYKSANKNLELAILDQPIKVKDSVVSLEVMGHVQEEIAQKMRPDLVGLIRKHTSADAFSIAVILKEEEEKSVKSKLYTNSDKFNFLKEKHPALLELQRKFGLDIDF